MEKYVDINSLLGKTIVSIKGLEKDSVEVTLVCSDGTKYYMFHEQDCCESVYIEDICGNIDDLLNSPILMAESSESSESLNEGLEEDSFTWTFYKLATLKGYVTIRWFGESNGYYSERVDFILID